MKEYVISFELNFEKEVEAESKEEAVRKTVEELDNELLEGFGRSDTFSVSPKIIGKSDVVEVEEIIKEEPK